MEGLKDERVKQVVVGASILTLLAVAVPSLLLGWRSIPGVLGEWVGMMMGILTTPFFMEATFAILGLVTVITLNTWRRHKDGDEFVYLEQVTGPDVPEDLPDQAKWAIYKNMPLDTSELSALEKAQGAFAIGDYHGVAEYVSSLTQSELQEKGVLQLRIDLALATGKNDLAAQLTEKLKNS